MRRRLLASLLGGALLLGACGGSTTDGSGAVASPSTRPSVAASPGDPVPADPSAPDTPAPRGFHEQLAFEAPQLDGSTFDGAVSGDVVLWFWAPW